jgi:phage terminase Nu1 subunit (DNA packaging protein)
MNEVLSIVQLPQSRQANRDGISNFFQVAPKTVDDWVRSGMPAIKRPTEKDKGWVFDILVCCDWKIKRDLGFSGEDIDPSKLDPKSRKDWFDSELKRTQLEEKTSLLIPKDNVERTISTAFSVISQNLRSIPDNIERKLGTSPEVTEEIERCVDSYLNELSISLSNLSE